ncbi:MAG: substrate-binding domain-containing protein [Clostridiales bacterium]|jgi:phosphate transport system substrate-binding protein|nr:substrate-binding domain-containing protein [Clostridiales bacterium]
MKKLVKIILVVLCVVVGAAGLSACTWWEKDILVIARTAGSGTRDAFDTLIKNEAGDSLAKKADGTAQGSGVFVKTLVEQDNTASVMTKVAANENSIGYISLGSVNETVKVLSVNGVAPSSETVLDGSYALKRPFVLATNKTTALSDAAADFAAYLNSTEAQAIVEANGYVQFGQHVGYAAPAEVLGGTVKLRGSTSVEPLMSKLIADYKVKGGASVSGITFDLDAQGSSAGITAAKNDQEGNVIGMSSSALKAADEAALNSFTIALDAVAIIVHNKNKVDNLTIAQIFGIYTGSITKFSKI